jgi:hypothetical protein
MRPKSIQLILCVALVAALLVAPASAEEGGGGILQAITDFFFWWLPATPDETPAPEGGMETLAVEIPGTNLTPVPTLPPEPTVTPEENVTVTPTPRTLGTVFAVDYLTAPPHGSAPFMVRFTAANETDIEYTHWDFGDGFSSTERDHWHTYESAGTYEATLTTGNATWNQTATIEILVEPPGVVPLPETEGMI